MAVNLVSPGISVREVDLTLGGITGGSQSIGAIAGPFEKGPVNTPILIENEQQLIQFFGKPKTQDDQYEYWMSASNYLSYGGSLQVIRADSGISTTLTNAHSPVSGGSTTLSLKINSFEDYQNNHTGDTDWAFSARTPGSWSNNLKVCVIDAAADQIVSGIDTTPLQVGQSVRQSKTNVVYSTGIGSTASFTGNLRGIITGIGNSSINVKIVDIVNTNDISTPVSYRSGDSLTSIGITTVSVVSSAGTTLNSFASPNVTDWYDSQTLELSNSTVFWKNIAPKPGTSQYAISRNSKNDEVHVVVVDDFGTISGTTPTILEKHLSLSKAVDGRISPSQPVYYKDYINQNSNYIFAGIAETTSASSNLVSTGSSTYTTTSGTWGSISNNVSFNVLGRKTYTFSRGTDYGFTINSYDVSNGELINSYNILKDTSQFDVNFIIGGPSGGPTILDAQIKANALIAIAEERKDCVVTISPYKSGVVNQSNPNTQTQNITQFFEPLTSSSYAVFDSGYKYTLDRFNNRFVYIPCNSDIAGIMARTATNNYPWFSPAGTSRGALLNIVKLAYNPTQAQRDVLYTKRINPIISSPGVGVVLFGDKTALSYVSAFDRINVRMLFLTIERSIEQAARAQLFEFNDAITRSNFVNIVEPYLRDVRAKRGITEFLVICDESNNTPEVIDSNQFKADIFVKPARSTNFIGLTFVATRTGISFSEVVGTV